MIESFNTVSKKIQDLESETTENTNEIYALLNSLDMLELRLKKLEDLIIGDNK